MATTRILCLALLALCACRGKYIRPTTAEKIGSTPERLPEKIAKDYE